METFFVKFNFLTNLGLFFQRDKISDKYNLVPKKETAEELDPTFATIGIYNIKKSNQISLVY